MLIKDMTDDDKKKIHHFFNFKCGEVECRFCPIRVQRDKQIIYHQNTCLVLMMNEEGLCKKEEATIDIDISKL